MYLPTSVMGRKIQDFNIGIDLYCNAPTIRIHVVGFYPISLV